MGKRVNFADVLGDEEPLVVNVKPDENPTLKDAAAAPLDWFVPDPRNHRTKGRQDPDLEDLAKRMLRFGQLQPVLVVNADLYRTRFPGVDIPVTARFVIIAGNRRYGAARLAGLAALYYLVRDGLLDPEIEDYREAALDENIHRLDLTAIEIARTLGEFVQEDSDATQAALAARLNRSQPWVSQHLALLKLPDIVQDYLDARRVGITSARAMTAWPQERLEEFANVLRRAASDGDDTPRPAITAVIEPPKEKATRKALTRFRTHHGPERYAALVCADLEPADAAVIAAAVIGQLDETGLDQIKALLATPRTPED